MKRFFVLLALALSSQVNALVIQDMSLFLNSPDLGSTSIVDSPYFSYSEFGGGLDLNFTDNLDSDGYGTFSWTLTNNTTSTFTDSSLFVFFDAEVDEQENTFFNENGELVEVAGAGAGDNLPDSWEIDEPEYVFGDIYSNLLDGALDNFNNVPAGAEDDVSLALGFLLGDFNPGDFLEAVFTVSTVNIGGLSHSDPDSGLTYYFNGETNLTRVGGPVEVPEPSSILLFLSCFSLLLLRRKI